MNFKINEVKGITLIALVVTIIVLLILAGVTIATLTGDNGILTKANETKFKNDLSAFKEELNIAIYEDYTEKEGNREEKDKFNARGYEEIIEIIPNFKKNYEEKIAIKDDILIYIGLDEKEKKWVEETGIEQSKILKINFINTEGKTLRDAYILSITDEKYSVKLPEIDGYMTIKDTVEGNISQDTQINVEYYKIGDDLAFEGLDEKGNVTTNETDIVSYAVTGIGNCKNTNIAIPYEYNGIKISKIKDSAFDGNKTINSLVIKSNIKNIERNAFKNCTNLKIVNIDAENIGFDAFWNCTNLQSVVINNNVRKIEGYSFEYCNKLTNFMIYSENITLSGTGIFYKSKMLKEIKVNDDNRSYKIKDGILYSIDERDLILCPPGKEENFVISENVERILNCAFQNNENISNIIIPEKVKTIGGSTFENDINLESIIIPANVISIGDRAFNNCRKLKEFNIPENVKTIGQQIFLDCTNLKTVTVNSIKTGINTFWRCTNLENVIINKNCTNIESYCFENCSKLTVVNYSGTIEEWNKIRKDYRWKNGANELKVINCIDGVIDL